MGESQFVPRRRWLAEPDSGRRRPIFRGTVSKVLLRPQVHLPDGVGWMPPAIPIRASPRALSGPVARITLEYETSQHRLAAHQDPPRPGSPAPLAPHWGRPPGVALMTQRHEPSRQAYPFRCGTVARLRRTAARPTKQSYDSAARLRGQRTGPSPGAGSFAPNGSLRCLSCSCQPPLPPMRIPAPPHWNGSGAIPVSSRFA